MADIRPAASLTSSLLARRGDARPAMRRQPISHLHIPVTPQEDLGWNDIGEDHEAQPPVTSLAAMTPLGVPLPEDDAEDEPDALDVVPAPAPLSPITHHLEAIAQRLAQAPRDAGFKPMILRKAKAEVAAARKAAFTLRIDPERHLRLRLLSALVNRSSQQLLIEALDALLAGHDKVEDLAGQVEKGAADFDEAGGL